MVLLVVAGGVVGLVVALSREDDPRIPRVPADAIAIVQGSGEDRKLLLFSTGDATPTTLVDDPRAERPTVSPDRTLVAYLSVDVSRTARP